MSQTNFRMMDEMTKKAKELVEAAEDAKKRLPQAELPLRNSAELMMRAADRIAELNEELKKREMLDREHMANSMTVECICELMNRDITEENAGEFVGNVGGILMMAEKIKEERNNGKLRSDG